MKLADRLACPVCHRPLPVVLDRCEGCGFTISRIGKVPVLRRSDAGEALDLRVQSASLPVQDSATLAIPFVREALASGKPVLEIGAGVDRCCAPNLVKTDAYVYADDLDYVVDVHAMPFADESFDYVYSLAVFEHLHTPWQAAAEIYRVLKPGGRVYVLSAFNQHIHAYPHHYFNMTDMGLKRCFADFVNVRVEPSPYCPLDQIGVSLLDLLEMVDNVRSRLRQPAVGRLREAIIQLVKTLPEIQSELIRDPANGEAWRRIAPGFDLYAEKPLA
ncbi:MAG: methyltransferase domain-containing protein [Rhodocyclaceae bacterium]